MADVRQQVDLFEIQEAPGRAMLHWNGKRPLRSIPYYPAQEREVYGPREGGDGGWVNRLYWGDNLQVMAHLMREFRGKVKLIYIDPPFDSKADYRKRIRVRDQQATSDIGIVEEKQYTDIWANDLYLQFMYERLVLMRELLTEGGAIYLHCDWRKSHYLRCVMDEVFGAGNFRAQIAWRSMTSSGYKGKASLGRSHADILYYSKGDSFVYNPIWTEMSEAMRARYWHVDDDGRRFKDSYLGDVSEETIEELRGLNLLYVTARGGYRIKHYLDEAKGVLVDDVWTDIDVENSQSLAQTNYPTQKPDELLHRILGLSSDVGDLVLDSFIGSGTTAAVAQKLGRRWIGCDINLGAIHTTADRTNQVLSEQAAAAEQLSMEQKQLHYPTFNVYNVNHYDVFRNAEEAKDIVLRLYGVERERRGFFDGTLDGKRVKVIDLNRICTKADIQMIFDNLDPKEQRGVVVLCSGSEYDLPEFVKHRNVTNLPFEIRDLLTDRKDVIFKRKPEARIKLRVGRALARQADPVGRALARQGEPVGRPSARPEARATLTIAQFHSPMLLQKLSLEDQPEAIEDWRQIVDAVLIDTDYDGEVLHPTITDTPRKRNELVKGKYTWDAAPGARVAIKIVDILDEEYFEVLDTSG